MNQQKPEPAVKGDGHTLDFHSAFFTIQGEGPFSGHRSVFIRLAGCNLQCPGCDTEYTEGRETWQTKHIVTLARQLAKDNNAEGCLMVITGGEPLRQVIGLLVWLLISYGHAVQIESNGVLAPDEMLQRLLADKLAKLIVSPKTGRINLLARSYAAAFKYVLDHNSVDPVDGLPILALGHAAKGGVARPNDDVPVYINPFDAGDPVENQRNLEAAAKSAQRHGYILGVQLHKIVGLA